MTYKTRTSSQEHRYGIGAVAKLTGLTDHTIRVWERRYGTVVAARAANGRRMYSAADVEKLSLLKRLTDQGLAIGQIAEANVTALRERVRDLSEMAQAAVPDSVRVAVLGDFLPGQLRAHSRDLRPMEVLVADSSPERFSACLQSHAVDVVVQETAILSHETPQQLRAYMKKAGAHRGVIVYRFARALDVESAADPRTIVLRAPIDVEELRAAVIRSYRGVPGSTAAARPRADESPSEWDLPGPTAPCRFDQQQLATLATTESGVDCECPRHLARLVADLGAFEIYSAHCADRDDQDAALHRYLHRTTAQARALIEGALDKLVRIEGLKV